MAAGSEPGGVPRVEGRFSLCVLFFLHAAAMAAYAVPFPNVLRAYGLESWVAWAVGTGSVAAFISPMIAGSLADRRVPPERLLAVLCFASGVLLILTHVAVEQHWGPRAFLGLMMAYALSNAPGVHAGDEHCAFPPDGCAEGIWADPGLGHMGLDAGVLFHRRGAAL